MTPGTVQLQAGVVLGLQDLLENSLHDGHHHGNTADVFWTHMERNAHPDMKPNISLDIKR